MDRGKLKHKLDEPVTRRNGWQILSVAIAILVGFATIHALIVVPAILYAASEKMDERIALHSEGLHPDAVSQGEFRLLSEQLSRIERKLDRQWETK